ncbi:MAG: 3-deoxy-8-phosphooctulonate synthase [Deltaproteobacteria bacterium]|jgi:2-dehydro-3-deoxyphosphooctonate aldolase (KDO 8-P synthase)|nr:3-deoxy-8-phosphooctulonate synthase [Deltaproteobacteria bacterium]
MQNPVDIGRVHIGKDCPLALIAGPCVLENYESAREIALFLKRLTDRLEIPFVFKASYDKANRTALDAFRGPGLADGLRFLEKIKGELNIPVLSDVHGKAEIEAAAEVLDIIQVPAFLCRQTDFILAVAQTQKPINIKKGQFLAPWDMAHVVEKVTSTGNSQILLTERGTMFGYNNLVVDFRSFQEMQKTGFPVIFDVTHSIQLPGGAEKSSGGQRDYAPMLARAAVAAGVHGIFMEVHKDPDRALCDGPNSLKLEDLENLLSQLKTVRKALTSESGLQ